MSESEIIKFYSGKPSACKYQLQDIWGYSFSRLESGHDYIQWMFPLDEPSAHNPDAPILTKEDIRAFQMSDELQAAVMVSVHTFMRFLFFTRKNWIQNFDHNHLRITRVLKCLVLLGMDTHALSVYEEVMTMIETILNKDDLWLVSEKSMSFWHKAVAPAKLSGIVGDYSKENPAIIRLDPQHFLDYIVGLTSETVYRYAISKGWKDMADRPKSPSGKVFGHPYVYAMSHTDHPSIQLHIPKSEDDVDDYAEAMFEVFRRLSDVEGRHLGRVLRDILMQ